MTPRLGLATVLAMAQPYFGPSGPQQSNFVPPPKKTNVGLIVGLVIGGVVLLGILAIGVIAVFGALGIAGTRSYLKNAKTAEAKNTLEGISRAVVSTYERERWDEATQTVKHELCGSAEPVPATVPAGKKYQPATQSGQDFESGDENRGWKCLRFTITSPVYYRYDYRVGSGYKGPARGGPDPGPDGFEISAEGDLDADGKTSLFTLTGKVDRATHSIRVEREIFVVDGDE